MARENLEDVYNSLVAINFDWNTLPATDKYRVYKEYKTDPNKRKLREGSSRPTGTKQSIGIRPFGLPFEDENKIRVKMSGRAFTWVEGQNGIKTVCNYLPGNTTGMKTDVGLKCGKATFAQIQASATPVSATSNKVTGRAYRRRTGETYTVPYGAPSATAREFDIQDQILAVAATINYSVTFDAEQYSRKR